MTQLWFHFRIVSLHEVIGECHDGDDVKLPFIAKHHGDGNSGPIHMVSMAIMVPF